MTDAPPTPSPDLALALDAARRAGAIVAERFATAAPEAERKSGGRGEVTQTDRDAEAVILATLRAGSPYPILSEEAGGTRPDGPLWVVDPLDGTTNFSRGIPMCAVAISLLRGPRVELGVIHRPISGATSWAERGAGAWCDGRRLRVSTVSDPDLAVLYLTHGYPAADRQRYGTALARFARRSYARTFGSTAYELTMVAAGRGDGWICSGDELWDFAAGIALVEEAGGRVSDWRGRPWDGHGLFLAITNGCCHDHVVETIADLQED